MIGLQQLFPKCENLIYGIHEDAYRNLCCFSVFDKYWLFSELNNDENLLLSLFWFIVVFPLLLGFTLLFQRRIGRSGSRSIDVELDLSTSLFTKIVLSSLGHNDNTHIEC